ncbi:hypothetical protein [Paracoccus versutus]|uniref:hypothetical protein n=1 Tax=Paracoccus versutus TaxID=34007 RepID=UPI0011C02EEE|nr:hypothetical protein [Paracoccus versutus]
MSLGDVIKFRDGSYEVRGIVDGRYVVRIRNRKTGVESYEVWASGEREEFDRKQQKILEMEDRASQVYERHLSGESYASLGREYGIRSESVRQICARRARKENSTKR